MQDLEDIRNGIQIVHVSDMGKRDSEHKMEEISVKMDGSVEDLTKLLDSECMGPINKSRVEEGKK